VSTTLQSSPVVVIGAGPVGLAAAAHLHERGLPFTVLEAGDRPAPPCGSGHTCGCSRRGGTTSTRPRAGSCTTRAGSNPIPTSSPPAANSPPTTCSPRRPAGPEATRPVQGAGFRGHPTRAGPRPHRSRDTVPFWYAWTPAKIPRPRRHRRVRHLADAERARRVRNPAHGETAAAPFVESALPDVLGADRDRFAGARVLVLAPGIPPRTPCCPVALATQEPGTTVTWAIRADSPAAPTAASTRTPSPNAVPSAPGCASTSRPAGST